MGVSFIPPSENAAWSADEGFGFELWSDLDRELALYYGAADDPSQAAARRISVLLDPRGELVLEYLDNVNVGTHPSHVLEDCLTLWGGG